MTTATLTVEATQAGGTPAHPGSYVEETHSLVGPERGPLSWLVTLDHKRIGVAYLCLVLFALVLGGVFGLLMHLEHASAGPTLVDAETYHRLFTMHGVVMLFLAVIPCIPAALGNFLLPMQLGARNVAFPRLNLLGLYVYLLGAGLVFHALARGGVDTGWTLDVPYSERTVGAVVPMALGMLVLGVASALQAVSFVTTIHELRAPGMTWGKLPLFAWGLYSWSLVQLVTAPVFVVAIGLLVLDRSLHLGFFDPKLGGDPLLFQHLFWFYAHAAVVATLAPAMGVVSEVIAAFTRRSVTGYWCAVGSLLGVGVLSLPAWGQHMFASGMSEYAAMVFSAVSFLVVIPLAAHVVLWLATLRSGEMTLAPPMLYALGFVVMLTIGAVSGVALDVLPLGVPLQSTFFAVGHTHYLLAGGTATAFLAGLHYWWPKITGRTYDLGAAKIAWGLMFVGFQVAFLVQFVVGSQGGARRFWAPPPELLRLNVVSAAGASLLALGFILMAIVFIRSLWGSRAAPTNPWDSPSLEWQTESPLPVANFAEPPSLGDAAATGQGALCGPCCGDLGSSRDRAVRLGVWLVVGQTVLLFGGLIVAYVAFLGWHQDAFAAASHELSRASGTGSTVVLLGSCFTAALASRAARRGFEGPSAALLALTVLGAAAFLALRYLDLGHAFHQGLLPGAWFGPHRSFPWGHVRPAEAASSLPAGAGLFFSMFFVMTGVHALYVLGGMLLLSWATIRVLRRGPTETVTSPVEHVAVFWQIVGVAWVFLFPLLYLVH
jgi:cytochrome c oxidase subunit 1